MGRKSRAKKERRQREAVGGDTKGKQDKPHWQTLKTFVALPLYRIVEPETCVSLLNLSQMFGPGLVTFGTKQGAYIEHARNELCQRAVKAGADRVLFVDGDVSFDIEDYTRLQEQLDKDPGMGMVSGMYSGHKDGDWLIIGWMNEDGSMWLEDDCQLRGREMIRDKSVESVDKCGAGFMLINREVFEKIPPLWFATMAEAGEFWGEDTYFIQLLKQNGFRPSVDGGVVVSHTGPTPHKPEYNKHMEKQIEQYKHFKQARETSNEVSK
jgi:hypothetical protein